MPFVANKTISALANVFRTTLEIHTKDVDPNVSWTLIVNQIVHAFGTSARTHVLVLVAWMPSVRSFITYRHAPAVLVILETRTDTATFRPYNVRAYEAILTKSTNFLKEEIQVRLSRSFKGLVWIRTELATERNYEVIFIYFLSYGAGILGTKEAVISKEIVSQFHSMPNFWPLLVHRNLYRSSVSKIKYILYWRNTMKLWFYVKVADFSTLMNITLSDLYQLK